MCARGGGGTFEDAAATTGMACSSFTRRVEVRVVSEA